MMMMMMMMMMRMMMMGDDDDDEDDNPKPKKAAPLGPDEVPAKSEDERTCESCWLIKPLVQFSGDQHICIDCA